MDTGKTIQPVEVERSDNGCWTHPDLPYWDESTSVEEMKQWCATQGLDRFEFSHFEFDAPDELVERWENGDVDALAEWEPKCGYEDAFLLSIYETEDGALAMYAIPN